jgi:hypothetical protein
MEGGTLLGSIDGAFESVPLRCVTLHCPLQTGT